MRLLDKKVRDRAVQNLAAFLSRGAGQSESDDMVDDVGGSEYVQLEEGEMAKLWKGLFYCELYSASIFDG